MLCTLHTRGIKGWETYYLTCYWGYKCKTCSIIWGYECKPCLGVTWENMDGANGQTGGNNRSNTFVPTAFISLTCLIFSSNTHQYTSSVLSIVGVQMDACQLQVTQCHLGCSLFFLPFSLLPPIPVTYLPIHLPTSSFIQPSLLPPLPFGEPSLPLCVHAFCRVESQVRLQAAKLVSCSGIDICYSLKMTSTSASTVCICLGVHPICQLWIGHWCPTLGRERQIRSLRVSWCADITRKMYQFASDLQMIC
jgi:hypothetical protein